MKIIFLIFLFLAMRANAINNACVVKAIDDFKPGAMTAMQSLDDNSLATSSNALRDKYLRRVEEARSAGKKPSPTDLAALNTLEKHQASVQEALAQRARFEAALSKAKPGSDDFKAAEAALARTDEKLRGLANNQDSLSLQLNNGERFDTAGFERDLPKPAPSSPPAPAAASPQTTAPKTVSKTYPHDTTLAQIEKKRSEFDALQDRIDELSDADLDRHEALFKEMMNDQKAILKAAGDATRSMSDGAPLKRYSALEALAKERVLTKAELQELKELTLLSP